MIAVLIQLIIVLLVCGVIWWAIEQLLPLVPLPSPIAQIIRVLLVVLLVLIVVFYAIVPLLHTLPHALG